MAGLIELPSRPHNIPNKTVLEILGSGEYRISMNDENLSYRILDSSMLKYC